MFCKVFSAGLSGIAAQKMTVEADLSGGLPAFNMVGSLSAEVREAKERVARALANSGIDIPPRRITINISPADIKKYGTGYDLAIAVSVLVCLEMLDENSIKNKMFVGELSLDGSIKKVNGILPVAIMAANEKIKDLFIPEGNVFEAAVVDDINVYPVKNLKELITLLKSNDIKPVPKTDLKLMLENAYSNNNLDYKDVKGQEKAKRATAVAVSGFHNLLYIGPPGSGKSMMARRIPSILNVLSVYECLEISGIYSVTGKLPERSLILNRPFRAPHHSITGQALVGGMGYPRPGEITMAHKGILFLDEAAEFKKETIELLRQPLEDKRVMISRARMQVEYPADFMLVLAMNPCRCGYYPDRNMCSCPQTDVERYFGRIKGPVLDRIDICTGTKKIEVSELSKESRATSSDEIREKVLHAQKIQKERFKDEKIDFNAQMDRAAIEKFCIMEKDAENILDNAYQKLNMTARGYHKTLKVARTIADMDDSGSIRKKHILEAISYRNNNIDI